jgi:uncharacterized DUF497 family protein
MGSKRGEVQLVNWLAKDFRWCRCGGLTDLFIRYNFYTVEFEFDPDKSASNKEKHGIGFVEAQALWDDPDLIEIPARTTDEPRFVVVGRIGRRYWSGIVTYREGRVRIISVRRARDEEIAIYED